MRLLCGKFFATQIYKFEKQVYITMAMVVYIFYLILLNSYVCFLFKFSLIFCYNNSALVWIERFVGHGACKLNSIRYYNKLFERGRI